MSETLPAGWDKASLVDLAEVQGGITKSPKRKPVDRKYPFLRVANVQRGSLKLSEVHEVELFDGDLERYGLAPGDLLVVEGNGSPDQIGRSAMWSGEIPGAVHQNHLIRVRPGPALVPAYLDYFWNAPTTAEYLKSVASSTSGLYVLTTTKVKGVQVLVPPLAEQKRIVGALDEVLSLLEVGVEGLRALQLRLKLMRASVFGLVSGGAANGLLPDGWVWAKFGDVAKVASNLVDPKDYSEVPHIAPNHIESGTGRLLPYTTVAADGVTSPKHLFAPGHILYSKIRPYLAKAVLVDFAGLCSADMYPITTDLDTRFLLLWMLTPEFTRHAAQHQGRSVLPKINREALVTLPVPVPPDAEQKRIVDMVEGYLTMVDAAEVAVGIGLGKAKVLRRSALAVAFQSRLVPQDPTDEPASVLLDRIKAARPPTPPRTSRRRQPVGANP